MSGEGNRKKQEIMNKKPSQISISHVTSLHVLNDTRVDGALEAVVVASILTLRTALHTH